MGWIGVGWSWLSRKITSFCGLGLGQSSTREISVQTNGEKSQIFIDILLIIFCQHLIVSPVIDTKHILYSFDMCLLLNSLLNYCRV